MSKIKTTKKCGNFECPEEERAKCKDSESSEMDEHHLFCQSQEHRRRYGSLLDKAFNKIPIPNKCHLWKPIPTWNEKQFRDAGEAAGFRMPAAGKSLQYKKF
jgi:hypothetical protein